MGIGRGIDRAIGVVFPGWAANRLKSRATIERSMSTYAAADKSRLSGDQNKPNKSADAAILPDRETILSRGRTAVRDTAQGAGARRAVVRRCVGRGITPSPTVMEANGTNEFQAFNDRAIDLFWQWGNQPRFSDVEKKLSIWARQRMAIGEVVEAGEHFVVHSYVQPTPGLDGRYTGPVGLRLQSFEPEQLDMTATRTTGGNEIRHGIEVDEWGAPVAYHFRRSHPMDFGGMMMPGLAGLRGGDDSIRIPADRVSHLFDQWRVRQSHGLPDLTPALDVIAENKRFKKSTLTQANMQACIGVLEETDGESSEFLANPDDGDGTDADGNSEINYQPGMHYKGGPGNKLHAFMPSTPGPQYGEFVQDHNRDVGAATGLGFGQLTMNFTEGTYSGQRQELLEVYAELDIKLQLMFEKFNDDIWRAFVMMAVLEGRFDDLGVTAEVFFADPERFVSCDWMGPRRDWIDPQKEMMAKQMELALGLTTRTRILAEMGYTLRETFAQIKREEDLAKEYGITLTNQANTGGAPVEDDATKKPADKAGGKGEDK